MVDATNAFNTINRQAALHNIGVICPAISTVLNNTYQIPVKLLVTGGGVVESSEGITQVTPCLWRCIYALAVTPLIQRLRSEEPSVKQVWFADDSTASGKIEGLRRWLQCLSAIGPPMGHHPNGSKTHLIFKPKFQEDANHIFEGTGIVVTIEGYEMLGSTVGSTSFAKEFAAHKVEEFVEEIENLSKIAERYPQSAYAAFSHCIVGKWRYMMRTMKDIDTLFQPLEDAISQTFIPALTGKCQCSYEERTLLSLPLRSSGLNIVNPVTSASGEYHASQKISEPRKEMIVEQNESFTRPQLQSIKLDLRRKKQQEIENVALQVRESLSPPKQRAIDLLAKCIF